MFFPSPPSFALCSFIPSFAVFYFYLSLTVTHWTICSHAEFVPLFHTWESLLETSFEGFPACTNRFDSLYWLHLFWKIGHRLFLNRRLVEGKKRDERLKIKACASIRVRLIDPILLHFEKHHRCFLKHRLLEQKYVSTSLIDLWSISARSSCWPLAMDVISCSST